MNVPRAVSAVCAHCGHASASVSVGSRTSPPQRVCVCPWSRSRVRLRVCQCDWGLAMSLRVCWCVCSPVWSRVWSDEPRGRACAGRSLSECVGPRVFASSPRMKLRSGPCVCALGCLCHCISAGVGALECRCVRARVQKWVSVSGAEGAGLWEQARPPATASRSAVCLGACGRIPGRPPPRPPAPGRQARALLLPSPPAFGLSDPWALNAL